MEYLFLIWPNGFKDFIDSYCNASISSFILLILLLSLFHLVGLAKGLNYLFKEPILCFIDAL